jgi:DNA-binding transcriptional regulator YhcF (GntR family)
MRQYEPAQKGRKFSPIPPNKVAPVFGHTNDSIMNLGSIMKGVGEGALSTMSGLHDMGTAVEGMVGLKPNAGEQELTQKVDKAAVAKTPDEQLGKGIETGLELGASGLTKTASSLFEKTGIKGFMDASKAKSATKAVQSTAETMTQGERRAATSELRQVGPKNYAPSQAEQRAGGILKGKVGSNPIKNVSVVKNEIAQKGKEAEQFLGQNGRPVSQDQLKEVFDKKRVEAGAYLSPAQMADYDHTIAQFRSELGKMTDVNTGTVYKALKNFEQNVTARLKKGNEALLGDSGSAKLEAAKMVRTGIRDMIGEMHPEYKEQMFNLASLYDALDNVVIKSEQKTSTIKPILKKALTWGAEAVGAGFLYKGAKDVGAPLP